MILSLRRQDALEQPIDSFTDERDTIYYIIRDVRPPCQQPQRMDLTQNGMDLTHEPFPLLTCSRVNMVAWMCTNAPSAGPIRFSM